MNPRYLWHVTRRERLPLILADGLSTSGRGWDTGFVWGYETQAEAAAAVAVGKLEGDVVLRIDTASLVVVPNPHPGWGDGPEGWAIASDVAPEFLMPFRLDA